MSTKDYWAHFPIRHRSALRQPDCPRQDVGEKVEFRLIRFGYRLIGVADVGQGLIVE
ncbi:MAG: hypothetical protein LBI99_09085 [Propionibacteriaceae bacterium]|jgi:hypothetical protein|nr:hypothetical protein [Propionibacteriaceae bacterium]